MSNRVRLAAGVVVEEMGPDVVVMVPDSSEVLTLTGDAAGLLRDVQAGATVRLGALVSELVQLGVLDTSGLSRRGFVKAGAIGAGAGIAVLSMPGVAAASSGGVLDGSVGWDGTTITVELYPPLPFTPSLGDTAVLQQEGNADVTVTFDGTAWTVLSAVDVNGNSGSFIYKGVTYQLQGVE
jgi:hypothetical protein